MKINSRIPFIAFQGLVKHSIISMIANEPKIKADFLLFPDEHIVPCFYLFIYYLNICNLKFSIYFKIHPITWLQSAVCTIPKWLFLGYVVLTERKVAWWKGHFPGRREQFQESGGGEEETQPKFRGGELGYPLSRVPQGMSIGVGIVKV